VASREKRGKPNRKRECLSWSGATCVLLRGLQSMGGDQRGSSRRREGRGGGGQRGRGRERRGGGPFAYAHDSVYLDVFDVSCVVI